MIVFLRNTEHTEQKRSAPRGVVLPVFCSSHRAGKWKRTLDPFQAPTPEAIQKAEEDVQLSLALGMGVARRFVEISFDLRAS